MSAPVSATRSGPAVVGPDGGGQPGARPRVLVIGGGAAGTLSAVHILRGAGEAGVELVLVDRRGSFGPGIAYATREPAHVLNVPACRMGGISGRPGHFHEWLERRGGSEPAAFLPRGLYGEYLRELLESETKAAPGRSIVTRRTGEVVGIDPIGDMGGPLEAKLGDGTKIVVDSAVLALGPPPAGDPIDVPEELLIDGTYVRDPWAAGGLAVAGDDQSVLIIGTGLTMVDVALSLGRLENGPALHAISRHGLVPRRHRRDLTRIEEFAVPIGESIEAIGLAMLEEIGRVDKRGGDWRDVFDSLRTVTPALWRALDIDEKRRFLGGLHRLWDVHRFRMDPDVADGFEDLQARGRLRYEAASIVSLEQHRGRVCATVRPTGTDQLKVLEVDRVLNCTGAGSDPTRQPLVAALVENGLARIDDLGLGLDVAVAGGLVAVDGHVSDRLHVVGALRKGVEWEAIGVTEIRDHAAAIAPRVLGATALDGLR